MCHHLTHENLAGSIVDKCGQPILVAAGVEDREFAGGTSMRISSPHIHDTRPPRSLGDAVPVVKQRLPERKELFENYPDLEEEDLRQALAFAAATLDGRVEILDLLPDSPNVSAAS